MQEKEFFDSIGSFGPWQRTLYGIVFYACAVGIWQNYAITFLAPSVPFRCVEPNATHADDWPRQCSVRSPGEMPCTRWEYDTSQYSDTLVSKWDLVCDREWLISFAKSVFNIGYMVSVFTFGQVSDWIGRRPTMILCCALNCAGLVLSLFSTSIELFLVFRFLQAFGRTSFTTIGVILLMETVGPRHRTFVIITIHLGWTLGTVLLPLVGYFFRDWFWFQVAIAVPALLTLPILVFVPESPRWLLMRAEKGRLRNLIATAAKRNGMDLKEDVVDRLFKRPGDWVEKRGTLLDLFRTPKVRWRTLVTMYLWLMNVFIFYSFSYNTNDLSGDPYLNFLLLGALEFPALGLLYLALRFFGRRTVTASFMLLGGATCLALVAVPNEVPWLRSCLSQAGKFFVTASFANLSLYAGEMFPTLVRSAAIGSASTVGRIGSILAPFTRELGKVTHPAVPDILLGFLAVSGGLFSLGLPETAGRRMPDTLEEAENDFELKGRWPQDSGHSRSTGRYQSFSDGPRKIVEADEKCPHTLNSTPLQQEDSS